MGLARTAREARKIIGERKILVDGRIITDYRFPLGLMDVLSIPSIKKYYRVLSDPNGMVGLFEIPEDRAEWKLVRINNKTIVKNGFTPIEALVAGTSNVAEAFGLSHLLGTIEPGKFADFVIPYSLTTSATS